MTTSGIAVLASALTLLLVGPVAGYPELTLVAVACAAALGIASLWIAARPSLSSVRELSPATVAEGAQVRAHLTISNDRHLRTPPITGIETVDGQPIPVRVPALGPRESVVVTLTLQPRRRGVYTIPPMSLGHSDPFRLLRTTSGSGPASTLKVYPAPYPLEPLPRSRPRELDGSPSDPVMGGVAFHSLRDYHEGDDWRLVHWASTARMGKLIVRHNVLADEVLHCVVLDTRASIYPDAGTFDDAVRLAASWCVTGYLAGASVLLLTTGQSSEAISAEPTHGRPSGPPVPILEHLASVSTSPDAPGLEAIAAQLPANAAVTLGVITGQASDQELGILAGVRAGASAISVLRVGVPATDAEPVIPGVLVVSSPDGPQAAARWSRVVQR